MKKKPKVLPNPNIDPAVRQASEEAVKKVKARMIVDGKATQSTAYKLEVTLKRKP